MRASVLLPVPFLPTKPTRSPETMVSVASFKSGRSPKDLDNRCASRTGTGDAG